METYEIEKVIWTETDFETMGWHDSTIYALSLSPESEVILDIDYIFKWLNPQPKEEHFKFWVSPCTLVFQNVYDLKFDIEVSEPFELEIADIHRKNPRKPKNAEFIKRQLEFDWIVELQQGEITFTSTGYHQYVKKLPSLTNSQIISLNERGGVSFERKLI